MLKNYINGQWVTPGEPLGESVCDANTGEALFEQRACSSAQLDEAIVVAQAAFAGGAWMARPAKERSELLNAVADEIEARGEAIAEADARSTGVIIALTRKLVMLCAGAFRQAADLAANPPKPDGLDGPHGALQIERLPLGPAAVIAPWNAPAGIACHKVASALAAGCPVLLKPSEWAPLSAQVITEAAQAAGLPAEMLQLVHGGGATGAELVSDPRVRAVSFTGGLAGGRAVAAGCAQDIKPAQLELGGNNPLIVLEDANLDAAIDGVVTAMTTLNGQWCRALGRLLVHESLRDALLEGVLRRLADIRLGSSMDDASQMGPLVSQRHHAHVRTQAGRLREAGGTLHASTQVPELGGWFLPPTLVTGLSPDETLEEIFGPVAAVHSFSTDAEAVALANQTPFGLAAYVFGEESHAWSVANGVRAGLIKLNAVTMLNMNPAAPRPAWGLSGLGDEGTVETFEFFRGTRVIGVAARP